jgi:hypothetical protein
MTGSPVSQGEESPDVEYSDKVMDEVKDIVKQNGLDKKYDVFKEFLDMPSEYASYYKEKFEDFLSNHKGQVSKKEKTEIDKAIDKLNTIC